MDDEKPRNSFDLWCEVTTCGGVVDWYKATCRVGKGFWLFILAAFLVFTCMETASFCGEYINSDKYQTTVTVSPQSSIPFPNVTICNVNRAPTYRMEQLNISSRALSYAFGSLPLLYDLPFSVLESGTMKIFEDEWVAFTEAHPDLADVRTLLSKLGGYCYSTVLSCSWSGRPFNCCSHITEVVNAYGKCYIISPPKASANDDFPRQSRPGASRGLKVILNADTYSYPSDLILNNILDEGFMVSPGYDYEPSLPNPIAVPVGVHAWIAMNAILETFSTPRYQVAPMRCRETGSLDLLDETYTKQNCIVDCRLKQSLHTCGCVFAANLNRNVTFCNATYATTCLTLLYREAKKGNICSESCLPLCDDTYSVSTSVSKAAFPAKSLLSSVAKTLALADWFVKDLSALDLYFPRLELTCVDTAETQSVFEFISNVGGSLGLFLGMSIMTLVQVAFYFYSWLQERSNSTSQHKMPKRIKTVRLQRLAVKS